MSFISTRKEFEECLLHFYNQVSFCSTEKNKWTWKTSNSILQHAYLVKETSMIIKPSRNKEIEMSLAEEEYDPSIVCNIERLIKLEHHITYSTSYQVPVLYLRAFYESGTPLDFNEIYDYIIPDFYQNVALSQQEHPILGTPYWYIHPCDTRKLMCTISHQPLDYIKSWLSVYGPMLKCFISTDMFLSS